MSWRDHVEPDALSALPNAPVTSSSECGRAEVNVSVAISLKRIADRLDADLDLGQLPTLGSDVKRVLRAAADPVGYGGFNNATEMGLAARAVLSAEERRRT